MNRREAAARVAKLRELATNNGNPHEAASAKKRADDLVKKFGLDKKELDQGKECSAYDDLSGKLETLFSDVVGAVAGPSSGLASASIKEAFAKMRGASSKDKSSRLRTFVTLLRAASMLAGDNPAVAAVKKETDEVLRARGVTL